MADDAKQTVDTDEAPTADEVEAATPNAGPVPLTPDAKGEAAEVEKPKAKPVDVGPDVDPDEDDEDTARKKKMKVASPDAPEEEGDKVQPSRRSLAEIIEEDNQITPQGEGIIVEGMAVGVWLVNFLRAEFAEILGNLNQMVPDNIPLNTIVGGTGHSDQAPLKVDGNDEPQGPGVMPDEPAQDPTNEIVDVAGVMPSEPPTADDVASEPDPTADMFQAIADQDLQAFQDALVGGADIKARDEEGCAAIHRTSEVGNYKMTEALIARHKKMELPLDLFDNDQNTPAHKAAANGHGEVLKKLDSSGSDLSLRNFEGKTPEDVATGNDWLDVADIARDATTPEAPEAAKPSPASPRSPAGPTS